jgi:hypothetical protein
MLPKRHESTDDLVGNGRQRLPWWVGVIGLSSLLCGILLVILTGLTFPRFEEPRWPSDYLFWGLIGGFWLCPMLLAYSFVLTTLRANPADWRRGRFVFLSVLTYLAIAGWVGMQI